MLNCLQRSLWVVPVAALPVDQYRSQSEPVLMRSQDLTEPQQHQVQNYTDYVFCSLIVQFHRSGIVLYASFVQLLKGKLLAKHNNITTLVFPKLILLENSLILVYIMVLLLGLKANVSEAEHPLLCESTRRQRGELAIAMLVHYKDDPIKLSKVMLIKLFNDTLYNVKS